MSDDFGTVNVRRGDRAREIDLLRQRYRAHRETISRLIGEAPSEHLAAEYQRLIDEIDSSVTKLNELERRPATSPGTTATPRTTDAGTRPLVTNLPPVDLGPDPIAYEPPEAEPQGGSRMILIVLAGLVVLGVLGWLIWRASSDRGPRPIVEQPAASTATQPISDTAAVDTGAAGGTVAPIQPVTPAPVTPAPASAQLRVTPTLQDYGTIRKGTRASRQFEVVNLSGQPMRIKVARSQCKCLYYEYTENLVPNKKETITVTVDGARAKAGDLRESLPLTSSKGSALGSIEVSARIQ
jgi:Protein of unknown function (DUF1573)